MHWTYLQHLYKLVVSTSFIVFNLPIKQIRRRRIRPSGGGQVDRAEAWLTRMAEQGVSANEAGRQGHGEQHHIADPRRDDVPHASKAATLFGDGSCCDSQQITSISGIQTGA